MPRLLSCLFLLSILLLAGCSESKTGPVEIKWDRDVCDRCGMVLSDRLHAAQIRGGPAGGKSRVYKFDDIGGAVVWLSKRDWKTGSGIELWVADRRDGRWIDGFTATYVDDQRTPMDFGFGAQDAAVEGGISFEQMQARVIDNEARRLKAKD